MEPNDRTTPFRGDLLQLAREARRMTQLDLARQTGVTQAFISMIEDGIRAPSTEQVEVFASALHFPVGFFGQPDPVLGAGVGEIFHRRRKSISAKDMDRIHAWMNITTFAVRRLVRSIDWPDVDLPAWSLGTDVDNEEIAADTLRARWYVPPGPIRSVSNILDRVGVLVIPMQFAVKEMDAIGQWTLGLPPMIFFNPEVPQDRLRFTLMHEVAHLVLHQRSTMPRVSEEIEDEANRFAAAFLLPQREIRPYLRRLDVPTLANLKRHWRVAMSAILMRAQQLETITAAESKTLWIEMSRNGWKKREPEHLDVFGEEPGGRYRELVTLHRNELGYSERELSDVFKLSELDTREHILPPAPGLRLVV